MLLSHDHHGDNLDDAGRELLPSAGHVVTTAPGARRLGGGAQGLEPWAATRLESEGRPTLEIVATPCRHGPPLSRPVAGHVIGFVLRWEGQEHGALWITGDTVLTDAVREVPERVDVGTALLHLGRVRFPVTGPLRYTMTGREAVELCGLLQPHTAIPLHYEGWSTSRRVARDRARLRGGAWTSGSAFGGYRSASAPRSGSEPGRTTSRKASTTGWAGSMAWPPSTHSTRAPGTARPITSAVSR